MPNRRIYTSAIASIVAVICVITIQCSYASYAAAAEPQHTYTVSDDAQVEKTHAPSLSEAPFIYGPQTRSFNSVASPSITKNLAFRCLVWVGLSGGDGAEVEFAAGQVDHGAEVA
ncbi:MAG: hypothetical protein E7G06_08715, partial [Bifidobacterium longum]|nr:hypothetical protein [Bifidobacterium longum]